MCEMTAEIHLKDSDSAVVPAKENRRWNHVLNTLGVTTVMRIVEKFAMMPFKNSEDKVITMVNLPCPPTAVEDHAFEVAKGVHGPIYAGKGCRNSNVVINVSETTCVDLPEDVIVQNTIETKLTGNSSGNGESVADSDQGDDGVVVLTSRPPGVLPVCETIVAAAETHDGPVTKTASQTCSDRPKNVQARNWAVYEPPYTFGDVRETPECGPSVTDNLSHSGHSFVYTGIAHLVGFEFRRVCLICDPEMQCQTHRHIKPRKFLFKKILEYIINTLFILWLLYFYEVHENFYKAYGRIFIGYHDLEFTRVEQVFFEEFLIDNSTFDPLTGACLSHCSLFNVVPIGNVLETIVTDDNVCATEDPTEPDATEEDEFSVERLENKTIEWKLEWLSNHFKRYLKVIPIILGGFVLLHIKFMTHGYEMWRKHRELFLKSNLQPI